MGYVHIGCLEQWLNTSSHSSCELCSHKFEVHQVRRYTCLQSFVAWIRRDHSLLYKPCLFIFFSTVNTLFLCWMWFVWVSNIGNHEGDKKSTGDDTSQNENQDPNEFKWFVIFLFLTLLSALTIKGFCVDSYDLVKIQYRAWYRFWNETVDTHLIVDLQNHKIFKKEEAHDKSLNFDSEYQNVEDSTHTYDIKTIFSQEERNCNTQVCGNSPELPEVHKV